MTKKIFPANKWWLYVGYDPDEDAVIYDRVLTASEVEALDVVSVDVAKAMGSRKVRRISGCVEEIPVDQDQRFINPPNHLSHNREFVLTMQSHLTGHRRVSKRMVRFSAEMEQDLRATSLREIDLISKSLELRH